MSFYQEKSDQLNDEGAAVYKWVSEDDEDNQHYSGQEMALRLEHNKFESLKLRFLAEDEAQRHWPRLCENYWKSKRVAQD